MLQSDWVDLFEGRKDLLSCDLIKHLLSHKFNHNVVFVNYFFRPNWLIWPST